ncbi:DUF2336 domain-containing protein [Sneathiella sp.]|uniref:DUF2336 domain-containing protein n=1 Tax=Sneathiella sp. TaxID=1964365 RepID=UPI0035696A69
MTATLLDTSRYEDRIAGMFADMSVETRTKTAQTVADKLAAQSLQDEDLALTTAIIEYLITDIETNVREAISVAVREYEFLPRNIAMKLARDIDEVSLPIVSCSPLFTDEDLRDLLETASDSKQTAIAGRAHLGLKTTGWIAENGCYPAIRACLKNPTSIIGKSGYSHILVRFGDVDPIQELIIHRPFLPQDIIIHLCDFVSQEFKQFLLEEKRLSEPTSTRMILNAREKSLAKTLNRRMTDHEQYKASLSLQREGRLTATLMLRTLISGNSSFFAAALGQASGISKKRVVSLTSGRGYMGFQRLYERAQLPPNLYIVFRTVMEEQRKAAHYHPRADKENFQQRLIDRIAEIYGWEDGVSLEVLMEKLLPNRLH